jgi:hypothetical protein
MLAHGDGVYFPPRLWKQETVAAPYIFGRLNPDRIPRPPVLGILARGRVDIAAGAVEAVLGVNAEQKPLEAITEPLSAVHNHADTQELEAID